MIFQFEDFRLDTERRELRRGIEPVGLEPQVFDLLEHLVRNRHRIVSKDDLIADVWDGRIVSDSTLSSRITAVRHAIGDNGDAQRLIRTVPRKGFRFVGDVSSAGDRNESGLPPRELSLEAGREGDAPPLPNKPSIAVLPFANMSGDPEQEYFADGITEDIITALSQFGWLFVIARSSSFTYRGLAVDVKRVGRELGVRYVLEGSVRKTSNRIRISGQLVDAATGAHLWASRFDGSLEDIFDLQDRVSTSVVGAIAPKLEQAEIERARSKRPESLDAYDHYLRGMASVHRWTREANDEALRSFRQSIEHDPSFAQAYGMAARCYSQRKFSGWSTDVAKESAEADRLARRAAELGQDNALALSTAGLSLAYVAGDLDHGSALIDRALELNPNLAWAWLFGGWVKVMIGEPDAAVERLMRAMRLSPQDPHIFNMQGVTAFAYFCDSRHEEAVAWAQRAFRTRPDYLVANLVFSASKALTGSLDEARVAMARVRQSGDSLRVSNLADRYPLRRPEDFARLANGLRLAGLPE